MSHKITPAEILASQLEGTGQATAVAAIRPVNYRAPIHLLGVVDAMAEHAGKSRAYMISALISVGICSVTDSLTDQPTIDALALLQAKHLGLLLDGATPECDGE